MSIENTRQITCPNCGTEGKMVIWESLNTQLDPEMKAKVVSGELFQYTCPKCKSVHNVVYDMLYHQMEDHLMIQLVNTEESAREAVKQFAQFANGGIPGLPNIDMGYRYRVVMSLNQLREKIYIFDQGLDDRVLEIMKLILKAQLSESNPDLQIEEMLLNPSENGPQSFSVKLENGQWGELPYGEDLYEMLKDKASNPDDDGKHELVVSERWALAQIEAGCLNR